jgi:hypothetical protein
MNFNIHSTLIKALIHATLIQSAQGKLVNLSCNKEQTAHQFTHEHQTHGTALGAHGLGDGRLGHPPPCLAGTRGSPLRCRQLPQLRATVRCDDACLLQPPLHGPHAHALRSTPPGSGSGSGVLYILHPVAPNKGIR